MMYSDGLYTQTAATKVQDFRRTVEELDAALLHPTSDQNQRNASNLQA